MVNNHMVVVSLLVVLLLTLMCHPLVVAQHHVSSSLDCSGENEEVARFQLYVGSTTPGAHWQLRCNNSTDLVWNQTILVRSRSRSNSRGNGHTGSTTTTAIIPANEVVVVPPGSWWYEHHCVSIDADTCEFSLKTSPDTFYALVVGATTITVSSKERRQQQPSIHETVCFGRDCDQPPLETDDDDDTTTMTSVDDDATAGRNEGEDTSNRGDANDAIQQNSAQTVKLIRQRGFILWIVSMAVILGMIVLVWYCAVKVRQQNHNDRSEEDDNSSDRKDDETLRAESGCFDESTSRDG